MQELAPIHIFAIALGAIYVVVTFIAMVITARDRTITLGAQVGWIALLLIVPVLGLPIWAIFRWIRGRETRSSSPSTAR